MLTHQVLRPSVSIIDVDRSIYPWIGSVGISVFDGGGGRLCYYRD